MDPQAINTACKVPLSSCICISIKMNMFARFLQVLIFFFKEYKDLIIQTFFNNEDDQSDEFVIFDDVDSDSDMEEGIYGSDGSLILIVSEFSRRVSFFSQPSDSFYYSITYLSLRIHQVAAAESVVQKEWRMFLCSCM